MNKLITIMVFVVSCCAFHVVFAYDYCTPTYTQILGTISGGKNTASFTDSLGTQWRLSINNPQTKYDNVQFELSKLASKDDSTYFSNITCTYIYTKLINNQEKQITVNAKARISK